MSSEKERQGDFVFTAKETGEYRFCFDNDMSTFAEKLVDFEIAVWSSFTFPSVRHPHGVTFRDTATIPLLIKVIAAYSLLPCIYEHHRSRMKPVRSFPANKALLPNRPLPSKSPSTKFQANFRPSTACKSTSVHARTAISVLSRALSRASSILASWRVG